MRVHERKEQLLTRHFARSALAAALSVSEAAYSLSCSGLATSSTSHTGFEHRAVRGMESGRCDGAATHVIIHSSVQAPLALGFGTSFLSYPHQLRS
jgi:hypothetical protein